MSTAKEEVESLLSKLPDDCSLEDIQYHLYVLEKVRHGLEAADNKGTLTQEEVEAQLNKWHFNCSNPASTAKDEIDDRNHRTA